MTCEVNKHVREGRFTKGHRLDRIGKYLDDIPNEDMPLLNFNPQLAVYDNGFASKPLNKALA
jgi:hypothetical protein